MTLSRSTLAALGLLVVLGTSACSGGSDSGSAASTPPAGAASSPAGSPDSPASPDAASSSPAAADPVIVIKDFDYQVPDMVPAGSTVTVRNDDSEAHTVTADTGKAFDVTIAPGATATFSAPGTPGAFPFHCTYHADMHGTLTVS